ncbi:hypothetical protein AMECASPLE_015583 [Ameca splendens]|uniref:Reverse transcriptase N-terminal domain-containing protein n=1 Tax=Ameca splendens TaxID=208324 RepID=A0ABV1AAX7_9TELE
MSGSVGHTIKWKTAEWTDVQKTVIDSLHKEGKQQKLIVKKLVTHRLSMFIGNLVERRSVVQKGVPATEIATVYQGLLSKIHSRIWGSLTRSGLRLESEHQNPVQTNPTHGVQRSYLS